MTVDLLLGDCLGVMATMEPCSVDAIVTDPPYGLEFMGKEWDKLGGGVERTAKSAGGFGKDAATNVNAFAAARVRYGSSAASMQDWHYRWAVAALRVAKPGAHLLAFGGTRTHHRLMCAIEDAGWQIRDTIMWVYGSGFPKSHNLHGTWEGWGTALKPAWEPIILSRKPLSGTVRATVEEYGTGALHIDPCRIGTEKRVPGGKQRSCAPMWLSGRGHGSGFGPRSPEHSGMRRDVGRWPANLIHDGSDEVTALMPRTQSGALNRANITAPNQIYGRSPREMRGEYAQNSGSAARFFYCAKASKADRDEGLDGMEARASREYRTGNVHNGHGGRVPDKVSRNHHPTVKPTDLMRYLVRLVTPPGGLILDPFMGSGSTGKAAVLEGFRFVGIDIDQAYIEIARQRIEQAGRQMRLPIVP